MEGMEDSAVPQPQMVAIKVVFGRNTYDINFNSQEPLIKLKEQIEALTSVPTTLQKLMYKGMLKDDQLPISQTQLKDGGKVMLMGSTVTDILSVNSGPLASSSSSNQVEDQSEKPKKFCEMTEHKKIIDKGRPEDGILGKRGTKAYVTSGFSLHGMLNQRGNKVRLTFKLEEEQLWIATNERTDKFPFNAIQGIVSEPITGQEDYHILALQLGPTEKSRYFCYFVPAQYVESIKDTVLGKFQFF